MLWQIGKTVNGIELRRGCWVRVSIVARSGFPADSCRWAALISRRLSVFSHGRRDFVTHPGCSASPFMFWQPCLNDELPVRADLDVMQLVEPLVPARCFELLERA